MENVGYTQKSSLIGKFKDALFGCNLRDLGYFGLMYTWERGKDERRCHKERLDHFVENDAWRSGYPYAIVENIAKYKSNRAPIFLCTESCLQGL